MSGHERLSAALAGWGKNGVVLFVGFDCGEAVVGEWFRDELFMKNWLSEVLCR